jgi:hypothetical protein
MTDINLKPLFADRVVGIRNCRRLTDQQISACLRQIALNTAAGGGNLIAARSAAIMSVVAPHKGALKKICVSPWHKKIF